MTGQRLKLYGMLHVWERLVDQTVKIYGRDAGEATDTLIAEVPVKWESDDEDEEDGLNTFVATLPRGLEHTTTLTALWEGDDSYLSSTGSIEVEVKAKVALKARTLPGQRVRLAAALQPSDAGGRIAFKRQVRGGAWRTIDVVPTAKTGRAVCIFKGKPGSTRIVAEFRGSRRNAKAVSRPITVVLR